MADWYLKRIHKIARGSFTYLFSNRAQQYIHIFLLFHALKKIGVSGEKIYLRFCNSFSEVFSVPRANVKWRER